MLHVPVLNYHKVAEIPPGARYPENYVRPEQFRAQLRLLRAGGYNSITVSQYLAHRLDAVPLPPRPVVLTFDDGYASNYDVALPIACEHGYAATVFLVSGMLGGTNAWDSDEVQEPLLSVAHIRELQSQGFEFQSHTRTHPRLTEISPEDALEELTRSRAELEQTLGAPVKAIAYPWGLHDDTVERLADEAGYEAGLAVRRRVNFDHTPIFALRRIGVSHTTSLARFAWDLFRLQWRGE
jgi:peptidoglycan/xylan/chitin deacetylase (PgdA/CDA1 family)